MKQKNTDALNTLQTMLPFKADNLTSKLTKLSLAAACFLGLIVGTAQVVTDYREQDNQLNSDINNILMAAEKPAKEAAYNLNRNVAAIVIDGLMQYSFIDNAVITDSFGDVLASGIEVPDIDSFTRSISSYLFDIDKEYTIDLPGDDRDPLYGQLSIIVDKHKAMDDLYERSLFILFSGLLRNLILGAMLGAVFYTVLTRPIVKVAEEIRRKNQTKNEKPGFDIPAELADNEIGALLTTFNKFVLGVKDADNLLRIVLDSSPTAMIISNISDGMILYANPVAQAMLGRTDAELVGSVINDFYDKMDNQELLFEVSEENMEIKDREPLKKQELLTKHKDGTKIYTDASIQLIEYEGNKVLISTFFDLTERKQSEAKIKASLKEKETLLQEIHHRVKNNMTVISSLLKLQMNNLDNKIAKEALQDSQNRVQSMSMIHETLYRSDNISAINLKTYLSELGGTVFQNYSISSKV
ncbi:MAG: PAS domain S-box protein, partial [Bacteroidetes bacterium]|nr:PAS domain S-box protein [Bacteroidota bacterium]